MIDPLLENKFERCMRTAIRDAKRRVLAEGSSVAVTVTVDQLMKKLKANNYRCALTGLTFWSDPAAHQRGDRFNSPSIDRIKFDGDYSNRNTRVVLFGVNRWRGQKSDAEFLRIARALVRRARRA